MLGGKSAASGWDIFTEERCLKERESGDLPLPVHPKSVIHVGHHLT